MTGASREEIERAAIAAVGPHRIVSILTSEAAEELQLAPGVLAVASVKSTDVVISLPATP